jgi:hypothetical protein
MCSNLLVRATIARIYQQHPPPLTPSNRLSTATLPSPKIRALYALEAAWCPGFDPAAAACRLDIEVAENRALFVALFRHAQVGGVKSGRPCGCSVR